MNEQIIREKMKGAEYQSLQQQGVDIDQIQKYVDDMMNGDKFPPIKVDLTTGNIVDGNHRYIASKITGIPVNVVPATQSMSKVPIPWDKIPIGKGWKW